MFDRLKETFHSVREHLEKLFAHVNTGLELVREDCMAETKRVETELRTEYQDAIANLRKEFIGEPSQPVELPALRSTPAPVSSDSPGSPLAPAVSQADGSGSD